MSPPLRPQHPAQGLAPGQSVELGAIPGFGVVAGGLLCRQLLWERPGGREAQWRLRSPLAWQVMLGLALPHRGPPV